MERKNDIIFGLSNKEKGKEKMNKKNNTRYEKDVSIFMVEEGLYDLLPEEVMIMIFEYLPIRYLVQAAQVNTRWNRLSQDQGLNKGTHVLVGYTVLDLAHYTRGQSLERLIGRPLFSTWTEYETRILQDGTTCIVAHLGSLKAIDLPTGKLLWETPNKGVLNITQNRRSFFVLNTENLYKYNKRTGNEVSIKQVDIVDEIDSQYHTRMKFENNVSIIAFENFVVIAHRKGSAKQLYWLDCSTLELYHTTMLKSWTNTSAYDPVVQEFKLSHTTIPALFLSDGRNLAAFDSNGKNIVSPSDLGKIKIMGYTHIIDEEFYLKHIFSQEILLRCNEKYVKGKSTNIVENHDGDLCGIFTVAGCIMTYWKCNKVKTFISGEMPFPLELIESWSCEEKCIKSISMEYNHHKGNYINTHLYGDILIVLISKGESLSCIKGLNIENGETIWTGTIPILPKRDKHSFDVKSKIIGSNVLVYYCAHGEGFWITVYNASTGRSVFNFLMPFEKYHSYDEQTQCIVS